MTLQDGEWVNAEAKSGDSAALTEENVLEAARIREEDGMKADEIIEEVTGCIQKGFNLFLQLPEKHKEAAEKMQEMVKAIMSTVDPTALKRSRTSAVSTAASTRSCSPGGRSAMASTNGEEDSAAGDFPSSFPLGQMKNSESGQTPGRFDHPVRVSEPQGHVTEAPLAAAPAAAGNTAETQLEGMVNESGKGEHAFEEIVTQPCDDATPARMLEVVAKAREILVDEASCLTGEEDGEQEEQLEQKMIRFHTSRLLEKVREERKDLPVAPLVEDEEAKMWRQLKEAGFYFKARGKKGNPIAGRWQRVFDQSAALQAKFKKAHGRAAQAEVRREWCEMEFTTYQKSKSKAKIETRVDWTKARYLAPGRIVKEEGGGKSGRRACANIMMDCLEMGEPWLKMDKRAKRLKFLYVEEGFDDLFQVVWTSYENWKGEMRGAVTDSTDLKEGSGDGLH